jgi:hypothetical protein
LRKDSNHWVQGGVCPRTWELLETLMLWLGPWTVFVSQKLLFQVLKDLCRKDRYKREKV